VKVGWANGNLYTAIGQLYLNSLGPQPRPKLVAVLPADLPQRLVSAIVEVGIEVLRFDWRHDEPVFVGLDKMRF
jgi:hypothetical protein